MGRARPAKLNVPFAAVNTSILVLSSVWCQMGVFAAERFQPRRGTVVDVWTRSTAKDWGMREWYVLTYIAARSSSPARSSSTPAGPATALTISSNAYGSVFYLTTGFHGLHVTGGLIAFLLIIGRTFAAKRFGHAEATGAIVTSYYWHFVDVVWIGLFFVIYILK